MNSRATEATRRKRVRRQSALSAYWPSHEHHRGRNQPGFVIAIPYAVSAGAMLFWGQHSDAKGERIWHVALAAAVSCIGFAGSIYLQSPVVTLCCLGLASVGIYATLGTFRAMPPMFLRGMAAAGGIALINSVGNLGGFAGLIWGDGSSRAPAAMTPA